MEHKKQTGHVCRWMVFGITIVTIVVGCTIVIGLFEWRRQKQDGEQERRDTPLA